jgi:hypothetical protein
MIKKRNIYEDFEQINKFVKKNQLKSALNTFNRLKEYLIILDKSKKTEKYNLKEMFSNIGKTTENNILEKSELLFNKLKKTFSHPLIVLVRHPLPADMNYSNNQNGRILQKQGIIQSKKFADQLIDELLICPYQKINLHFSYTSKTRTQKLAEITNYIINKELNKYDKKINVKFDTNNELLYPETVKQLGTQLKGDELIKFKTCALEIKEKGMNKKRKKIMLHFFAKWVDEFKESKDYASKLKKYFQKLSKIKLDNIYDIYILFTHESAIVSFAKHQLDKNAEWPNYTDFIKVINTNNSTNYLYKDKWYK